MVAVIPCTYSFKGKKIKPCYTFFTLCLFVFLLFSHMSPEDKVVLRWKCHGQSSGKLMVPAPAGRQADRFGGGWSAIKMVELFHDG